MSKPRPITIEMIQRATAAYYGETVASLKSNCMKQRMLMPRWVAMALCAEMMKTPIVRIEEAFNRDHRQVKRAVAVVAGRVMINPTFSLELYAIRANIAALTRGANISDLQAGPMVKLRHAAAGMTRPDRRSYVGIAVARLAEGHSVQAVAAATGLALAKVEEILADPAGALEARRRLAPRFRPKTQATTECETFDFDAFAAAGAIRFVPGDARKPNPERRPVLMRSRSANVTAAICGDPAPGRSALDQRESRNGL